MAKPRAAEAELFSKLILGISSSGFEPDFYSLLANRLREGTHSLVVTISEFDSDRGVFSPVGISGDPKTLQSAAKLIGKEISSIETVLPHERVDFLVSNPATVTRSLEDATFGAFSKDLSEKITAKLNISVFQRLALTAGSLLIGTVLFAYSGDSPPIDKDAAVLLAHLCGLLIREHRALAEKMDLETRSRQLIDMLPESIFETDSNGLFVYANPAALSSFGFTADDLEAGISVFSLIAPEDLERARQNIARTLKMAYDSGPSEYTLLRRDRSRLPALVSSRAVTLKGNRTGLLGVVVDLSKTKHAESSRAQLVAAVEQSAEGILITDNIARIQYVNPAFMRITGTKQEDISGKLAFALSKGQTRKNDLSDMWKILQRGEIWQGIISGERLDGSVYHLDTSASPVRGESGAITNYVAAMRDVTYERELEERFRHSQKMEAIGRLAGGIAHDFNNLMTAIAGYAALIGDTFDKSDSRQGDLNEIVHAVERASALTDQLLAFSRKQVIQPESTSVPDTLFRMRAILSRLLGEDIHIDYSIENNLPRVFIDPVQIEQIILNLVVNARDAMPGGGTLEVIAKQNEQNIILSIRDTGEGMTEETLSRIFEPFFTTKPPGEGTGLGLSTVYGIVQQNSGSIKVDSKVGEGTCFTITLPTLKPAEDEGKIQTGDTAQKRKKGLIMLVEDEELVRNLTAKVLERAGFDVIAFSSPLEALKRVIEGKPPIALLITDVVMPEMNGRDLADKLTELKPGIRILFMSGYTNEMISSRGIKDGDVPFLQKPFTPAALIDKIEGMLSGPE